MPQKQAELFAFEKPDLLEAAGLDEAGRGCLAGPVVAAAVLFAPDTNLPGLDDSKKLKPATREKLARQIKETARSWSIGVIWQARIDKINILNASLEAMCLAARNIRPLPGRLALDGNQPIRHHILNALWPKTAPIPEQFCIIQGDRLIPAISAASIIAKTFRDNLMRHLARRWPGYYFEKNMGYGTKEHLAAIASLGCCQLHRKTFRGVM